MSFSFRDKPRLSERLRGKSGDDLINELKNHIDQERKMFFDTAPNWGSVHPSGSFSSRTGFPFDDDMMPRSGRQDIRAHLDDLAQRHPEFAEQLRCPPWAGEMSGSPSHTGTWRRGSNEGEPHTQARSSSSGSNVECDTGTSSPKAEDNRGRNPFPQQGEPGRDDGGNRGQRSMSAPPDARNQQSPQPQNQPQQTPQPQRFVSRVNITPGKPPVAPQKPQSPQQSSSNVRHIPIFVEGRDEPILPKNLVSEDPPPEQVFSQRIPPQPQQPFSKPQTYTSHHQFQPQQRFYSPQQSTRAEYARPQQNIPQSKPETVFSQQNAAPSMQQPAAQQPKETPKKQQQQQQQQQKKKDKTRDQQSKPIDKLEIQAKEKHLALEKRRTTTFSKKKASIQDSSSESASEVEEKFAKKNTSEKVERHHNRNRGPSPYSNHRNPVESSSRSVEKSSSKSNSHDLTSKSDSKKDRTDPRNKKTLDTGQEKKQKERENRKRRNSIEVSPEARSRQSLSPLSKKSYSSKKFQPPPSPKSKHGYRRSKSPSTKQHKSASIRRSKSRSPVMKSVRSKETKSSQRPASPKARHQKSGSHSRSVSPRRSVPDIKRSSRKSISPRHKRKDAHRSRSRSRSHSVPRIYSRNHKRSRKSSSDSPISPKPGHSSRHRCNSETRSPSLRTSRSRTRRDRRNSPKMSSVSPKQKHSKYSTSPTLKKLIHSRSKSKSLERSQPAAKIRKSSLSPKPSALLRSRSSSRSHTRNRKSPDNITKQKGSRSPFNTKSKERKHRSRSKSPAKNHHSNKSPRRTKLKKALSPEKPDVSTLKKNSPSVQSKKQTEILKPKRSNSVSSDSSSAQTNLSYSPIEKYPERYQDVLDTKTTNKKNNSASKSLNKLSKRKNSRHKSRSHSHSPSRNRRVAAAVIPRVRLRSSSGEEDDDDEEKDTKEKEEDNREMETLKLLKSGLAEKAKESLEKKLTKSSPEHQKLEELVNKDIEVENEDRKDDKDSIPVSSLEDSVCDIALPQKNQTSDDDDDDANNTTASDHGKPDEIQKSPVRDPSPPKESDLSVMPDSIPKPPGSPPAKKPSEIAIKSEPADDTTPASNMEVFLETLKSQLRNSNSPPQRLNRHTNSSSRSRSRSESPEHSVKTSHKSRSSSRSSSSHRSSQRSVKGYVYSSSDSHSSISRSASRSRSRSSHSDSSRSGSRSRSCSSSSSFTSSSTTRSRSPSIPRRRGSPSFLDRRRITRDAGKCKSRSSSRSSLSLD